MAQEKGIAAGSGCSLSPVWPGLSSVRLYTSSRVLGGGAFLGSTFGKKRSRSAQGNSLVFDSFCQYLRASSVPGTVVGTHTVATRWQ